MLYAPFAAMAFSAYARACCASGYCPMPGHHHGTPAAPAPAATECEHSSPVTSTCSLQCCQDTEKSFLHALVFELPLDADLTAPLGSGPAWMPVSAKAISFFNRPLAPPPRLSLSA